MRIIHLASGDLWAGAEVQLFHLAVALAKLPDVTLLIVLLNTGQLEQELKNKGIEVIILDESQLSGFSIIARFNQVVKQFNPTLIHTHRTKENVIGGLVARFNGCKSIRTAHGASEFTKQPFNLRRSVFSFMDKFAAYVLQDKIIAVSDELKDSMTGEYPERKIEVIHNSVDFDYINMQAEKDIDFHFPASDLNIVFVGRFVPVKCVDLFYEIARQSLSVNKNIHFYMIGDGPLKTEIETRIEADKLEANIHLVGFVANPLPYLKQMDLLIFTSEHEGLPMTLLEAMSLKIPVLSAKLPTIKRVLNNGACGYICDNRAPATFVDSINTILANKAEAAEKAMQAYHLLHEKHTITGLVRTYSGVYQALLEG